MTSVDERFLEAARGIGRRLAEGANWSGDACTWIIAKPDPRNWRAADPVLIPANGDVYQGTAGIALFLTELYRLDRDPRIGRTLRGALQHAWQWAQQPTTTGTTYYSGDLGVACALHRFATVSADELADTRANQLVAAMCARAERERGPDDVIGGAAGAIPGLLSLARRLNVPEAYTYAASLGERLLRIAHRGATGWSWGGSIVSLADLTGYAHGTAGFAHALAELYAASGNGAFWYAAEQSLAYDSATFIEEDGNWPDYRNLELDELLKDSDRLQQLRRSLRAGEPAPRYEPRQMLAWCHGAPGIGLSRLRCWELTGDERFRNDAVIAATSTLRGLSTLANNYSLCHGLSGNAELATRAGQLLGFANWCETARECLLRGVIAYEEGGRPWPSGALSARPDPSLLLGEAGIGHSLLRHLDPSIPSVLLVEGVEASSVQTTRGSSYDRIRATHIDQFFGATRVAFETLIPGSIPPCVAQDLYPIASTAQQIRQAIATHPALRDQLNDAARVDLARYDRACEHPNRLEPLFGSLVHVPSPDVDWARARLRLSPHVSTLQTEQDWEAADENARHKPAHYIVYNGAFETERKKIGPFVALIFEALGDGATIEQLHHDVADAMPSSVSRPDTLRKQLAAQIVAAYDAGLLVFAGDS